MPRFRTLTKTYDHLKTLDSETAVTPYALRRMVISGHIPSIKVGKKYLIDIDLLNDYLKEIRPEDVMPGYEPQIRLVQNNYRVKQAK